MITWGEFKKAVEDANVTEDLKLERIDIDAETKALLVVINRENERVVIIPGLY